MFWNAKFYSFCSVLLKLANKEKEMGEVCVTHQEQKCIQVLVGKCEQREPLGRPMSRWEGNIHLKEITIGDRGWNKLATQGKNGELL